MDCAIDLTSSPPSSSSEQQPLKCATSWCRALINPALKKKRCLRCLKADAARQKTRWAKKKRIEEEKQELLRLRREAASRKRPRSECSDSDTDHPSEDRRRHPPPCPASYPHTVAHGEMNIDQPDNEGSSWNEKDDEENDLIPMFVDREDAFDSIKSEFRQAKVDFIGQFMEPNDPLVSCRERVQLTQKDIWAKTGYRFTVHDHPKQKSGHRTRYHCSQDAGQKQKSRKHPNEELRRDTLGMRRYPCHSKFSITYFVNPQNEAQRIIQIQIQHSHKHVHYSDISMPEDVLRCIRDNVEHQTPVEMAREIRATHPQITPQQIHKAWVHASEALWRRKDDQFESALALLLEYPHDVDVFETPSLPEDIKIISWGMKKVAKELDRKVVEVAQDATYNTNSKHLELYSLMAEHDNAGYPLGYCLLTTASSVDQGKRITALSAWTERLRDRYNVNPKFVHTDKDMGEIGMTRRIWSSAKISLCLWHLDRAVSTRLASSKLATTPYEPENAHAEFSFIDQSFKPPGKADPNEYEGGSHDVEPKIPLNDVTNSPRRSDLQPRQTKSTGASKENTAPPSRPTTLGVGGSLGGLAAGTVKIPGSQQVPRTRSRVAEATTILTSLATREVEADNEEALSKRVFCPQESRQPILAMVRRHYHAHPLIPAEHHPSAAGIKQWAVLQMYEYCVKHDLRETWAYLWGNWYRKGRWELWARAVCDEIPVLKTTMILESHWRRIKRDFLHHFHCPRLDLLVWLLVKKLAPNYYFQLSQRLNVTGRDRFQESWRKHFKSTWRYLEDKEIDEEAEAEVYRPNPKKWVCGCPAYAKNRFLLCKHLIQSVQPISKESRFFHDVKRARTVPFWSHPELCPLNEDDVETDKHLAGGDLGGNSAATSTGHEEMALASSDDDDDLPSNSYRSIDEEYEDIASRLETFSIALRYQKQFHDRRFLDQVKKTFAPGLRLADECAQKERSMNSTRGEAPATWQSGGAMLYRHRPSQSNM